MKLYTEMPKRLFTFGCSFTKHYRPTWANILSEELGLPVYNYGRGGAGNQYIFNQLMQADNYFKISQNDLVIVCWTNLAREDRWIDGRWQTHGNIYTQNFYSKNFVVEYFDEINSVLRDLAVIKASYEFLKNTNCQFHFLKMIDLEQVAQFAGDYNLGEDEDRKSQLFEQYREYLRFIQPSFYSMLWNNDLTVREDKDKKIHPLLNDRHPDILEHLEYLERVFDEHQFSVKTKQLVAQSFDRTVSILRDCYVNGIDVVGQQVRFLNYVNEINTVKIGNSLELEGFY